VSQGGTTTNLRKLPKPGVRVIHIDINPAQPGANYPNVLPLVRDARSVLRQMLEAAGPRRTNARRAWLEKAQQDLCAWRHRVRERTHGNATRIRPEQLAAELVKACPADTLYVTDTGYVGTWAGVFMDLPAGKNFLHCEGGRGWAFPAAIGAKAAVAVRPVVAFTGDGGFFYYLPEVEKAVRNRINLITVVLNNRAMALQTHLLRSLWAHSRDLDKLSEFGDSHLADVGRPGRLGPARDRSGTVARGDPAGAGCRWAGSAGGDRRPDGRCRRGLPGGTGKPRGRARGTHERLGYRAGRWPTGVVA
jgi:acetolactate synthase-1/2/3 large subunit